MQIAAQSSSAAGSLLSRLHQLIKVRGQNNGKRCAFSPFALDFDFSFVVFNDLIANRQPQAGPDPDTLGRETRVENFSQFLRRDTDSTVRNGDVHLVILLEGGDGDFSFARDRLTGVVEDI